MAQKRLTGKNLAAAIEERTGHAFADHGLLTRALTHASARTKDGLDYQRLEFLGDRVLGLVVSEMLFKAFPQAEEGELSVRLNALVNAEALAEIAEEIELTPLIQAGSEIRGRSGRKRLNLRADVMESLIAALYLDGGLDAARRFIHTHWTDRSRAVDAARGDPKTVLQEWAHQVSGATPDYALDERKGPDHDPVFTMSVRVMGYAPGHGSGRSKREAEQVAATEILEREGVWQRRKGAS